MQYRFRSAADNLHCHCITYKIICMSHSIVFGRSTVCSVLCAEKCAIFLFVCLIPFVLYVNWRLHLYYFIVCFMHIANYSYILEYHHWCHLIPFCLCCLNGMHGSNHSHIVWMSFVVVFHFVAHLLAWKDNGKRSDGTKEMRQESSRD